MQSARQAPQYVPYSAEAAAEEEMNQVEEDFCKFGFQLRSQCSVVKSLKSYTFFNLEQVMVGIPVCVIKGGSVICLVLHHHHRVDDSPKPDDGKIRNKEYFWEFGDCAYFDMKC